MNIEEFLKSINSQYNGVKQAKKEAIPEKDLINIGGKLYTDIESPYYFIKSVTTIEQRKEVKNDDDERSV